MLERPSKSICRLVERSHHPGYPTIWTWIPLGPTNPEHPPTTSSKRKVFLFKSIWPHNDCGIWVSNSSVRIPCQWIPVSPLLGSCRKRLIREATKASNVLPYRQCFTSLTRTTVFSRIHAWTACGNQGMSRLYDIALDHLESLWKDYNRVVNQPQKGTLGFDPLPYF